MIMKNYLFPFFEKQILCLISVVSVRAPVYGLKVNFSGFLGALGGTYNHSPAQRLLRLRFLIQIFVMKFTGKLVCLDWYWFMNGNYHRGLATSIIRAWTLQPTDISLFCHIHTIFHLRDIFSRRILEKKMLHYYKSVSFFTKLEIDEILHKVCSPNPKWFVL